MTDGSTFDPHSLPAGCAKARRVSVRAAFVSSLALIASAVGGAAASERSASASLRTSDVLALADRFGRPSGSLPDASQLGVKKVLAYEEHRAFVYVMGEGPSLVRRVVFLKPGTLVVDDQVRGPGSRWLLASRGRPDVEGRKVRITEGGAGILCETLLPEKAAVKARPQDGGGEVAHLVEVVPPAGEDPVRFLHVLRVGDGKDASPPKCELASGNGAVTLKVAAGDRTLALTLPPGCDDAGTIAVSGADGKALLPKRLLPAGIMPHGEEGVRLLERWDRAYHDNRRPGWDVGRPATELKKAVEEGTIRPGRAVVLGCGTGTNAIYLAQKGFDVTGIDVAPTGLAQAEAKARKAGVRVRWLVADVLAPPKLEPFDFLFDRGCYHHVRRVNAAGFVDMARRLSRGGSRFLILAASANETRRGGPPRVKESEIRGDFSELFDFQHLREIRFDTRDPKRQSVLAWSILLRRKDEKGSVK
ncbi:MAG: class I SAM-dependent methyltransferase [Phycisphaerae bacterium]